MKDWPKFLQTEESEEKKNKCKTEENTRLALNSKSSSLVYTTQATQDNSGNKTKFLR